MYVSSEKRKLEMFNIYRRLHRRIKHSIKQENSKGTLLLERDGFIYMAPTSHFNFVEKAFKNVSVRNRCFVLVARVRVDLQGLIACDKLVLHLRP